MNTLELEQMVTQMREELTGNILPFWSSRMKDAERGGYFGRMTGDGAVDPGAPKGAIMYARILWTFSAAFRVLGEERYRTEAEYAKRYLLDRFADPEYGGVYWSLTAEGAPLDTKKQFYALAFAIYGLSEYARATGDGEAQEAAVRLFEAIEQHSFDSGKGGYVEAAARSWESVADMRLSDKDMNEAFTANTHLHILEAYTNLYRVWRSERLAERIAALLELFMERIVLPGGRMGLFFDKGWNLRSDAVSFGHEIEASWLLHDAAAVLGDALLLEKVRGKARCMALTSLDGLLPDGSMAYERKGGDTDTERHWWVQCETVVGLYYLERFHGEEVRDKMAAAWSYIRERLVDPRGGEWFWSILPNGSVNRTEDKAGFWKCPYHNGRMCLELIEKTRR